MDYKSYHLIPDRLDIPQELAGKRAVAESLGNIASAFEEQKDFTRAMEYRFRELEALESIKDKEGISFLYNIIGCIYESQDDSQNALEYFSKSLSIAEKIHNEILISSVLNNIGIAYRKLAWQSKNPSILDLDLSFLNKAIENLERSLEMLQARNDEDGIATVFHNIGMVYRDKKDFSLAQEYFVKSLEIKERQINKPA